MSAILGAAGVVVVALVVAAVLLMRTLGPAEQEPGPAQADASPEQTAEPEAENSPPEEPGELTTDIAELVEGEEGEEVSFEYDGEEASAVFAGNWVHTDCGHAGATEEAQAALDNNGCIEAVEQAHVSPSDDFWVGNQIFAFADEAGATAAMAALEPESSDTPEKVDIVFQEDALNEWDGFSNVGATGSFLVVSNTVLTEDADPDQVRIVTTLTHADLVNVFLFW